MRHAETVIVGGGPAGAATACCLAEAGADVLLLEREREPHHKVCGEFLSVETLALLRSLGIYAAALGAAPIDHLALHCGAKELRTRLPFRAFSLSRLRLDAALLRRAEDRGAEVRRNVAVRSIKRNSSGWTLLLGNGDSIGCRHLVLATGKSGLRGITDDRDHSRVGLKIHLRLPEDAKRALAGSVRLHFLDIGYAGLGLVEDELANLCVLLDPKRLPRQGASWTVIREFLSAAQTDLGNYLAGGVPVWERPLVVACPTRGYLSEEAELAVYRVGDRIAHIPPFTGDGLAIALVTGALAAAHIRDGRSPEQYHAAARKLVASSIRVAGSLAFFIGNKAIRTALLGVAGYCPGLIGAIIHCTRVANVGQSSPRQWHSAIAP